MPDRIINLRQKTESPQKSGRKKKKAKIKKPARKTKPAKKKSIQTIEWRAPEFIKYKKEKSWFLWAGLIFLAVLIYAIFTKNVFLIITVCLAAFTVYVYALKKPRNIRFGISGKGIKIENQLYAFNNLKSFWIFYDPPEIKELSIRSKKMMMPYIRIPLGKQNPVEIRELLLKFLPERQHKESAIDALARRFRF